MSHALDDIQIEQPALPGLCPVTEAVGRLADEAAIEKRGAIFTRPEVVDFILDLVGYTPSQRLHEMRVLEPSFGSGDFLLAIVERLLTARRKALAEGEMEVDIRDSVCAVELHHDTFQGTRARVVARLVEEGFAATQASQIVDGWLIHSDFLLVRFGSAFDFVVGNPPYVRQELIPAPLLQEYRRRFTTLFDRADLYIPFIERSLRLLAPDGQLGFICADRWMKNRYGGPLRALVAAEYHLRAYVDMVDTPAFHAEVIAYPAITVISRNAAGPTLVAKRPRIDPESLRLLAVELGRCATKRDSSLVRELSNVTQGAEPWILHAVGHTELVRRIEAQFPALEESGCKVGIGVATGADKAYIGPLDQLDVEPDRKLPLVMTRDIATGHVCWRGYGVVNPFADDGSLVDLADFPRLKRYLELRKDAIAGRHVARKMPVNWYRTIDRITRSLASRPKLLIPDIKGEAHVVYEDGHLYPHHNLYFVISDTWDLRALQAVLLSNLSRLFIRTYSTRMRGGFLRFQAQYLRRIRLPRWEDVSDGLRSRLVDAAIRLDTAACDDAVATLYSLSNTERAALADN